MAFLEFLMDRTRNLQRSSPPTDFRMRLGGFCELAHHSRRVVEVIGTIEGNGTIVMQFSSGFDGSYSRLVGLWV